MKRKKLKIGKLYELRHKWLIPFWDRDHDWQNSNFVLYLGEKNLKKQGKHFVIKHDIMVDGKILAVDTDFLRFLEPIK